MDFRQKEKSSECLKFQGFFDGRRDRIWTCGHLTPSQVRYQTAPLPAVWYSLYFSSVRIVVYCILRAKSMPFSESGNMPKPHRQKTQKNDNTDCPCFATAFRTLPSSATCSSGIHSILHLMLCRWSLLLVSLFQLRYLEVSTVPILTVFSTRAVIQTHQSVLYLCC